MPNHTLSRREVEEFLTALKIIEESPLTLHDAQKQLAYITACEEWLHEETKWKSKVQRWLDAELKFNARQAIFDDPTYAAARRGWDGSFDNLADSLQFRYAVFAAAVMEYMEPPEVKSNKQVLKEQAGVLGTRVNGNS
jgi:hypothetical protein